MEVNTIHPYKSYYAMLMRFALVMTLLLVGCGLWAILVETNGVESAGLNSNLGAATAYYDAVQN